MSHHNVTYKPGGAIGKGIDLTLKMQRVKADAAPVVATVCPECLAPLTDLVAVWTDATGNPIAGPAVQVTVNITLYNLINGTVLSVYTGAFLKTARLVNSDWETNGLPPNILIDQDMIGWSAEWSGTMTQPLFAYAGSTCAVAYNDRGIEDAPPEPGILTITPEWDGQPMNQLTLEVLVVQV